MSNKILVLGVLVVGLLVGSFFYLSQKSEAPSENSVSNSGKIEEVKKESGQKEIEDADCLLVAVAHDEFRTFSAAQWAAFYGSNKQRVLMDIKGIIPSTVRQALDCAYWKL